MRSERIARIDLTTGLGDRIALENAARAAIARSSRVGESLSVVVLLLADADDILVRDQSISLALRASVRDSDQLFRYDEDTIVALLPMAKDVGASKVMQRTARLCDRPFAFGVAAAPEDGIDIDVLVDQASRGVLHISY